MTAVSDTHLPRPRCLLLTVLLRYPCSGASVTELNQSLCNLSHPFACGSDCSENWRSRLWGLGDESVIRREITDHIFGSRSVSLIDDHEVSQLQDAGLKCLDTVSQPRNEDKENDIRNLNKRRSFLTGADRFQEDEIETVCIEQRE